MRRHRDSAILHSRGIGEETAQNCALGALIHRPWTTRGSPEMRKLAAGLPALAVVGCLVALAPSSPAAPRRTPTARPRPNAWIGSPVQVVQTTANLRQHLTPLPDLWFAPGRPRGVPVIRSTTKSAIGGDVVRAAMTDTSRRATMPGYGVFHRPRRPVHRPHAAGDAGDRPPGRDPRRIIPYPVSEVAIDATRNSASAWGSGTSRSTPQAAPSSCRTPAAAAARA